MRVMIVVTHLLGTGHLARALVLARALHAAGHQAHVVSGGLVAPHLDRGDVEIHQLPPVQSDGVQFTRLLDAGGHAVTDAYLDKRRDALLATYQKITPDVLMTELFPFGRRVLREEFVAVLDHAATQVPRPRIVASVRDILAPPSKPTKAEATEALVSRFYDAVLVHSDPQITPLSASWPVTGKLENRLRYTGFVAAAAAGPHPEGLGKERVLVSVGGGSVGEPLLHAAIAAAGRDTTVQWHLLVGGRDADEKAAGLARRAPANAAIEPTRSDFRQMLYHARASVSLCGYNTALDILQAGTPAVFVPFEDGGEIEQRLRAQVLTALPGVDLLPAADLTADRLLTAVRRVLDATPRGPMQTGFDGARETVSALESLVDGARHAD